MGWLTNCINVKKNGNKRKNRKNRKNRKDDEQPSITISQTTVPTTNLVIKNSTIIIDSNSIKTFNPRIKRHLIIDDLDSNRYIIKQFLKRIGIESDEASNGKEGLDMIETNKYDIVWIDLRMPVMDGFEFIKNAKHKLKPDALLIAVTGDVAENSIKECYRTGFDMVMLKPILSDELYNSPVIKKYTQSVKVNK